MPIRFSKYPPPPPPPRDRGKKSRRGDDDFFDDFSKENMNSIINWELHQKLQKPAEIKTEFDFKKESNTEKNKIKNEVIPMKKFKKEDNGLFKKLFGAFKPK
jgi:hypothetical protein